MKMLFILLHIGAYFAGLYDNGDMAFFVMLILIDICVLWDKLASMKKRAGRKYAPSMKGGE
jgi:hypothetical protein